MSTYSAEIITLPRFTAAGAFALGEQLTTAGNANKKGMSKPIAKAFSGLTAAHAGLGTVLRDQVSAPTTHAPDTPSLDRRVDNNWSGLDDFLLGFSKLEGTPQAAEAAALRDTVFPDGLKFLKLPYPLEWSESEVRLLRLKADKGALHKRIEALGGGLFLTEIAKSHAEYGKALGMGAEQVAPTVSPEVRSALDKLTAALRTYVLKVVSAVDDEDAESQAFADKLLLPLANWDVGPTTSGAVASPPAPPAPPAPITPKPGGG